MSAPLSWRTGKHLHVLIHCLMDEDVGGGGGGRGGGGPPPLRPPGHISGPRELALRPPPSIGPLWPPFDGGIPPYRAVITLKRTKNPYLAV